MEAIIGVIAGGIVSILLGYFSYRRSVKVDATAAQAENRKDKQAGVEQVIDGLNDLINALQVDNKIQRDRLEILTRQANDQLIQQVLDNKKCNKKIEYLTRKFDDVEMERNQLQHKLDRLIEKYNIE